MTFFPVYIVVDDEVKDRIGVFEAYLDKLPQIYDDDDEIDEQKINILLFDFVDKPFLSNYEKQMDHLFCYIFYDLLLMQLNDVASFSLTIAYHPLIIALLPLTLRKAYRQSINLSIYLSIHLSISSSIDQSIYLSIYLSISPSLRLDFASARPLSPLFA